MIAKDSTSYPYLAIAQHYNVSYAEVLRYSESYNAKYKFDPPFGDWRLEVWLLEREKQKAIILPK